ncbi:MAG: phage tail protein [Methanoregula sp.]|jgi:phage tail-like protein
MTETGKGRYPKMAFRFRIEIEGITVAQASEVTGLSVETDIETYEEGGNNLFVYQLPKRTKYVPLILRRGITDADELWEWYDDVRSGHTFKRRSGAVVLLDDTGSDFRRWNFKDAFPVKWSGPELKTNGSTIAFESVTLAHHGISRG